MNYLTALIAFAALLTACAGQPAASPTEITVFAAASLTDAFGEIGRAFEASHANVKVTFSFGGSQQLRTQLEQGATADVFASANAKEMKQAQDAGLVDANAVNIFVRNRLTVIVPKDNPARIDSLQDLAKPGLKLVFAAEEVPVGGYTLQALAQMSADPSFGATFSQAVRSNVVSLENNVKQVVAKVQLGEADGGIVYTSDVTPSVADKIVRIDIPDKFNVIAEYPIAALQNAAHSDQARRFVDYVLSPEGQATLVKWGFITVKP